MLALVAALVLLIGISVGVSGYGGFLVPILLVVVLGMDPRSAVAHGLISFVVPGLIGAWLYWRKQNRPSMRVVLALCAGTVPGVLVGRVISVALPEVVLQVLVALLVAAAGISMLVRRRRAARTPGAAVSRSRLAVAAVIAGFLAGIVSVLAGVGGPLVTVPVLVAMGAELAPAVGAALLNSVFNVALGAGALADLVHIDWPVLVVITLAQLVGMPIGAWLHDRIGGRLVPVITVMALASSAWLLVRALG